MPGPRVEGTSKQAGVTLGSLVLLSLETPLPCSSPLKSSYRAYVLPRDPWAPPWLLPIVSHSAKQARFLWQLPNHFLFGAGSRRAGPHDTRCSVTGDSAVAHTWVPYFSLVLQWAQIDFVLDFYEGSISVCWGVKMILKFESKARPHTVSFLQTAGSISGGP